MDAGQGGFRTDIVDDGARKQLRSLPGQNHCDDTSQRSAKDRRPYSRVIQPFDDIVRISCRKVVQVVRVEIRTTSSPEVDAKDAPGWLEMLGEFFKVLAVAGETM